MGTPQHYGKDAVLRHALYSLRNMTSGGSRARPGLMTGIRYGAPCLAIFATCNFIVGRIGIVPFILFLAIFIFGLLYSFASWRSLFIPLSLTILAVGGFRFLWSVEMPGLPDLYVDRVAMIWLVVIFSIKSVVERKTMRPPFLLDTLLIVNALYLFLYIGFHNFDHFNLWTKSYLMPYTAFFMAKNIVTNQKLMRSFLIMLAVINVYYAVTSIAEKFQITQLVWPKSILYTETVWHDRSNGPFAHAPLFGTVMGMILPVYLYLIATTKNRVFQVANYVALALGFAGLYFTYTRGSWLAGIGALLVAVIVNRRHYLKVITPVLVVVPLLAVFVLGIGKDPVMKVRVENEDTMASRVAVAVTALRMWRDNPLVGVGFFRYRYERLNYIDPVDVPVFGTVRVANFRHTSIHDIYLGPLAETGLVGTLLQIFIYLMIFKAFFRQYRNRHGPPHFRYYILPVFGGMFIGYLIGGIAIDYRFFSAVGAIFYSAAGIIYGYTGDKVILSGQGADGEGAELDEEA